MSSLAIGVLLAVLAGLAFVLVGRAEGPERQLQILCGDDAALAARLIESELKRTPGMSREEAARRALRSARRDSA